MVFVVWWKWCDGCGLVVAGEATEAAAAANHLQDMKWHLK
jgi:hypothetical protein